MKKIQLEILLSNLEQKLEAKDRLITEQNKQLNNLTDENKQLKRLVPKNTPILKISDCGCKFESLRSNAIILCDACSELPCHQP